MIQMIDMVCKKFLFISLNARLNSTSAVPFATSFWDDFLIPLRFLLTVFIGHLRDCNNKELSTLLF